MEVLGLLLRVACVFALLFAVLAVLKRTDGFRAARRTSPMQVLGSTRIGKGAALTVVRIGEAEYVLGVTDHTVSLITGAPPAPAEEPVADVLAPEPELTAVPKGDFAAALGARLGARLAAGRTGTLAAGRTGAPALAPQVPPTPAEFLRSAYRVARRRPAETTDVSLDAVSAALASVRGEATDHDALSAPLAVVLPLPRTAAHDALQPARPARPSLVPDGSATPTSRHALRRAVARTDALRNEEHLWTRSCRPTSRSTALDDVLG